MRVLAFDTSTALASVAVVSDGEPLVEIAAGIQAKHDETLLPLLDQALRQARLPLERIDLIAVGIGPGSFTGVRVGLATAKGLALATGKPLVGVVSLRVLARGAVSGAVPVAPVLDAFKSEVYLALFADQGDGRLRQRLDPVNAPPGLAAELLEAAAPGESLLVCGEGARKYARVFTDRLGARFRLAGPEHDTPRAVHLASEAVLAFEQEGPSDLFTLEPLYIRPSDAKLPVEPIREPE